jgi:hypothetical protein
MKLFELYNKKITTVPLTEFIVEEFGLGAQVSPFEDDDLKNYLSRTVNKKKEKSDKFKNPYIHKGAITIVDKNNNEFDLEDLKNKITKRPSTILSQNKKMSKSGGGDEVYFNVGIPALRGLGYNESEGRFVIINTCPGAGECKIYCYAKKGGYVQWVNTNLSQTQKMNFLLNDPKGFEEAVSSEIESHHNKHSKNGKKVVIRWHDSGDFFSPEYLQMAFRIARRFPEVDFYAYTKMADVVASEKPDNFNINFSQGALRSEEKKVDINNVKHSKVVPKELFKDLVQRVKLKGGGSKLTYSGDQSIDKLKNNIADHFKIDADTLLTYDEFKNNAKSLGNKPAWNVIVMPGEGDESANHSGVKGTYLLFH